MALNPLMLNYTCCVLIMLEQVACVPQPAKPKAELDLPHKMYTLAGQMSGNCLRQSVSSSLFHTRTLGMFMPKHLVLCSPSQSWSCPTRCPTGVD